MLLKLYQAGQLVLRKTAKPLTKQQLATKRTQEIIDYMIATLRDAPGVGLAAPQVGESLRIIIIEDKSSCHKKVDPKLLREQGRKTIPLLVLINPVLKVQGNQTNAYFEGCLSVEGYAGVVARAQTVTLTAWDRHGNAVSYEAHGWFARILQHEIDHLQGTLYTDKMLPASFMTVKNQAVLYGKALESKLRKTFAK